MLTAVAVLMVASLVGGVFGSVATYTYVDQSEGKYCDKMSDKVLSPEDEEYYYNEYSNHSYGNEASSRTEGSEEY
jgi:cysteine sulfinate desulfinase/cysteine desulfurase-like protein